MRIDFTRTDGVLTMVDCIVLPDDHTLTAAQIEAVKDQRFAEWVASVAAASAASEGEE